MNESLAITITPAPDGAGRSSISSSSQVLGGKGPSSSPPKCAQREIEKCTSEEVEALTTDDAGDSRNTIKLQEIETKITTSSAGASSAGTINLKTNNYGEAYNPSPV